MWSAPIYSEPFLQRAKAECEEGARNKYPGISVWNKISGLIHGQLGELHDVPLFYLLPNLQSRVKAANCPLKKWKTALRSLGKIHA
jgi:hypothetical protein